MWRGHRHDRGRAAGFRSLAGRRPCVRVRGRALPRRRALRRRARAPRHAWPGCAAALAGVGPRRGVIESARDNAERAGVAKLIDFTVAALSDAPIFVDGTLGARTVVTNPPYGLRVGDTRTLQNLYQRVGTLVRALPEGSRAALLTPPPRVRDLGLQLERAFESNHGGQHVIASVTAS
ncbi:MAG: hypothetical protein IPI43_11245 [Sandaracinaceae bacterium]|nr:hypothetical protein [Sandaracinaceae bacterium]